MLEKIITFLRNLFSETDPETDVHPEIDIVFCI